VHFLHSRIFIFPNSLFFTIFECMKVHVKLSYLNLVPSILFPF
jgi:hypothetical protein